MSGRFNKILSQLECVYQIAPPVVESVNATNVSDFIHAVFENKDKYGIGNTSFSAEWFSDFSERCQPTAVKFIDRILNENGHSVSGKVILEGIAKYNEGFDHV